jgi:hypothetical protein
MLALFFSKENARVMEKEHPEVHEDSRHMLKSLAKL